jgi:hypothetical protein
MLAAVGFASSSSSERHRALTIAQEDPCCKFHVAILILVLSTWHVLYEKPVLQYPEHVRPPGEHIDVPVGALDEEPSLTLLKSSCCNLRPARCARLPRAQKGGESTR